MTGRQLVARRTPNPIPDGTPAMTQTDEDAFLAAVLAAPDDDTPRLVYADWLDERGSADDRARAALVRAQCRLEHLPPGRPRAKLAAEARAVLKKHARAWTQALTDAKLGTDWTFRRGFIDGGAMSPTTFVRRGDELFALAPTLRAVRFVNAANETSELAASPFLARLSAVDLSQMCTCGWCAIHEELADLFKSRHATGLKCLSVARDRIDGAGAVALARAKVLANLTELDLSHNPLDTAGVEALVRSRHLGKLTTLNLAAAALQNAAAEALAGATAFRALTRLDLSFNGIGARGTAALAASPLFRRLAAVDLSSNGIGEGGAAALAKLPADAELEQLVLRGVALSDAALARLKARFGKALKL